MITSTSLFLQYGLRASRTVLGSGWNRLPFFRWISALSAISSENAVSLFPTVAARDPEAGWKVLVQGDIYTSGHVGLTKRLLLRFLQRLLRASDEMIQGEIFQQRIGRFLARDERGKTISVRIGNEVFPVPDKSGPTGHFSGMVRVPDQVFEAGPEPGVEPLRGKVEVEFPAGDGRKVAGEVFLLNPEGISVISDIDDTVKHSYVACRRTLLQKTFLKEFEVIEGMADVYRRWASHGAAFHYVSSSPWHLYQHLANFLALANFPDGSYHLRSFRLRDHFFRRFLMLRRAGKGTVISSLLRMFPRRQFVLVGDSGESDPEIYGAIARRFPEQVRKIYIRDLGGPKSTAKRYARAFRQLPTESWQLFRNTEDLSELPIDNLLAK